MTVVQSDGAVRAADDVVVRGAGLEEKAARRWP
jgi:hypothetical protein